MRASSFVFALISLGAPTVALTADFYVGAGGGCTHPTVQAAVNAAAANGTGLDLILVSRSVTHSNQHVVIQNHSVHLFGGLANCNSQLISENTVLSGTGGAADAVVEVLGSGDVRLTNLDLRDGDTSSGANGGGLAISGGPHLVTLENVLVTQNTAGKGGGIAVNASAVNGITLQLDERVYIAGNNAVDGAGIYCTNSIVRMRAASARFSFNQATRNGGGIRAENCSISLASADPVGLFFSNQAFVSGGGISVTGERSVVDIYSVSATAVSKFVANTARTGVGGAIDIGSSATVRLWDVALIQNSAPNGAAVAVFDNDAAPSAMLYANRGPAPADAVACAPATSCSRIDGNFNVDVNGAATAGATVFADAAGGGAGVELVRTHLTSNQAGRLIHSDGYLLLEALALTRNTTSSSLIDAHTPYLYDLSIGGNTVGASVLIQASGNPILDRIAAWQPGKRLYGGSGSVSSQFLIANDLTGIPPSTNNLTVNPLFVDAAAGDLRLQPGSIAVDYAASPTSQLPDLDGRARPVDIVDVVNAFGPRDVGAYERANGDQGFRNGFE